MQLLASIRPHARLQRDLDAYVDGELGANAHERMERHLAGCTGCSAEVARRAALKVAIAALPEVPAPRSVLISEALLARSTPPRPVTTAARSAPLVALRFTQLAAGLAIAGFVATVVVDAADTGGGSGAATTASPLQGEAAGPGSGGGVTSNKDGSAPAFAPTRAPVVPGGVSGQGFSSTPPPVQPSPEGVAPAARGVGPGNPPPASDSNPAAALAKTASGGDTGDDLRPLEVGLGAAALVALVGAFGLTRLQRRTR